MRILLLGAIFIAIGFLSLQSYRLIRQYRHTQNEYEEIIQKMAPFAADNEALQANLKALQAGRGAERELHNAGYAAQGEKMLIIIPKK
ncbi:MAG: hypothetical protein EXS60_01090 [Candidatus Pacebacteria bacterium]|nr:hypothetical protein [Candidatus Paceibacterota bacterium]